MALLTRFIERDPDTLTYETGEGEYCVHVICVNCGWVGVAGITRGLPASSGLSGVHCPHCSNVDMLCRDTAITIQSAMRGSNAERKE